MLEIEDESGLHWFVYENDPAWSLLQRLPKTVSFIVLPRSTILSGRLCEFFFPDIPITDEVKKVVIRMTRLKDILHYLRT